MAFAPLSNTVNNTTFVLNTIVRNRRKLTATEQSNWETALHAEIQRVARTDNRGAVAAFVGGAVPTQADFNNANTNFCMLLANQGTSSLAEFNNQSIWVFATDPAVPANKCRQTTTVLALIELFKDTCPGVTLRVLVNTYATSVYLSGKASNIVFHFGAKHGVYDAGLGFDSSSEIDPSKLTSSQLSKVRHLRKKAIYQSIIDEDITRLREENGEFQEEAKRAEGLATSSTRTRGHRKNVSSFTLTDQ